MPLLTIQAVADDLDCSTKHVRRIIARGELPVIAIGTSSRGDRIDSTALEAFKQRKLRNRSIEGTVCPSANVTVFGSRASKSVASELNDLLGKAPAKRRRKN